MKIQMRTMKRDYLILIKLRGPMHEGLRGNRYQYLANDNRHIIYFAKDTTKTLNA